MWRRGGGAVSGGNSGGGAFLKGIIIYFQIFCTHTDIREFCAYLGIIYFFFRGGERFLLFVVSSILCRYLLCADDMRTQG